MYKDKETDKWMYKYMYTNLQTDRHLYNRCISENENRQTDKNTENKGDTFPDRNSLGILNLGAKFGKS